MQRGKAWPLVLSLIVLLSIAAQARAQTSGFKVDTKAAVLMDGISGQVLFEQNATARIAPASLTKIMTAYLAYDALQDGTVHLHDPVSVSKQASRMGGSQIFLKPGDRISFRGLLQGVAIASGNDATIAVAEHLAGFPAAFVVRMNAKADKLGLTNTQFQNPHGLPAPDQYTTAFDVAQLALYLIRDHPAALELHSVKSFEHNGIAQHNRNRLLSRDPRVNGLKTGWLKKAGYHIAATAQEEERQLIAVVLGARSERVREDIALRLLNYGFKNFHTVQFFSKGERVKNLPVWKGTKDLLGVYANGPGIVAVKNGSPRPTLTYDLPDKLIAPISEGQKLGEALITAEGQEIARIELVAQTPVPQAGLLTRLLHSILLLFY
ncbi:MAG: D-alanyl-D-alanine carboxypeptidase family protein [Candidatus Methylomirabilales bacterium]